MSHEEAGRLGAIASKQHSQQIHREYLDRYNQNPKICPVCNEAIPYEKRENTFCSGSCAARFTNRERNKNIEYRRRASIAHGGTVTATSGICLYCGQEIPIGQKYCSVICCNASRWIKTKQQIERTGMYPHSEKMNDTNRKTARKYMEEVNGHKCSICGNTEWNGRPIPLVTDHIDGDSTNHAVTNLRLICPNCDAQSDTYKFRNARKSTRRWRKKYYGVLKEEHDNSTIIHEEIHEFGQD